MLDATAIVGKTATDIRQLLVYQKKNRGSVTRIADRLDSPGSTDGAWLILTPKDQLPQPDKVAFPKPPKAADGSLMYERIPNKCDLAEKLAPNVTSPVSSLKRRHEDVNGVTEGSE